MGANQKLETKTLIQKIVTFIRGKEIGIRNPETVYMDIAAKEQGRLGLDLIKLWYSKIMKL